VTSCAGRCYLCLELLKLPLAHTRCPMSDWDGCIKRQNQQESDAWYAEEVKRMAERAPA
jgi:hypothetical protein